MENNYNKSITPLQKERLKKIRHIALDMDGTIYLENKIFPFTLDFLASLAHRGISYSFLTNNPTRSVADYLKKLEGMGIPAKEENIYTTSLATIDFIKKHLPGVKRLYLMGTPSMVEQFEQAGFEETTTSAEDIPDCVVVAFDPTLEYEKLCRAAWWIKAGIPYIATNPDRVCPTDQPTVLVDCGSLCAALEYATGRKPDITLGKPDPNMLSSICERNNLKPEQIAMVGDRIYTDIAMAHNAGALGVLVLSGETTLETALSTTPPPDIICRDIKELGELLDSVI
ncbi:MAG: HAD-IIA family hydrolase [Bacteroidales bacterium]|nr:HAD-IIA family hydrolase [Bacteroidales bacterium]